MINGSPRSLVVAALLAVGCGDASYDLDGGDVLTVGKAFADQRGCPACHQSPNAADGVLSGQTTPRPGTTEFSANLTPDHATGIGDWADLQIIRAMRFGIDAEGMRLCPSMPHFDGTDPSQPFMSDLEANAIVAWLRSLPPVSRPIPPSLCPPIKGPPLDMAGTATDDQAVPPPVDLAESPPPDAARFPDASSDASLAPVDGGAG